MARIMVWSSLRIMRLHTNYRFMKIDISECKAANIPLITSAGLAMDLKVIVRSGEHSRKIKGCLRSDGSSGSGSHDLQGQAVPTNSTLRGIIIPEVAVRSGVSASR